MLVYKVECHGQLIYDMQIDMEFLNFATVKTHRTNLIIIFSIKQIRDIPDFTTILQGSFWKFLILKKLRNEYETEQKEGI